MLSIAFIAAIIKTYRKMSRFHKTSKDSDLPQKRNLVFEISCKRYPPKSSIKTVVAKKAVGVICIDGFRTGWQSRANWFTVLSLALQYRRSWCGAQVSLYKVI